MNLRKHTMRYATYPTHYTSHMRTPTPLTTYPRLSLPLNVTIFRGRNIIVTMGSIEKSARARLRKQNIQQAMLSAVAVAGVLALGMLAPNTLRLLKYAPKAQKQFRTSAYRARRKLVQEKYIEESMNNGFVSVRLTKKGEEYLERIAGIKNASQKRKWDGQWRVVVFDIPERRKNVRDYVRSILRRAGFKLLQGSVWVHPHDCEDLIALLKADAALGKELPYIVSKDIEGDSRLRKMFNLPVK